MQASVCAIACVNRVHVFGRERVIDLLARQVLAFTTKQCMLAGKFKGDTCSSV